MVNRYESPARGQATHRGSAGSELLQLGLQEVEMVLDRPATPLAYAIPFLRLVNGSDHRGVHLIRVAWNKTPLAVMEARISAEWASFGLDLSPWLGHEVSRWPTTLALQVTAEPAASNLRQTLRPGEPPPALVVNAQPEKPGSAWIALPTNESRYQSALGLLASEGGRDYLGWMLGCAALGLWDSWAGTGEPLARMGLEQLWRGPGEGFPLVERAGRLPHDTQNLESYLPLAPLALWQRIFPDPAIKELLWAQAQRMLHLLDQPRNQLTTEGAYTLAFPLAALARTLHQPEWSDLAVQEVLLRWRVLRLEEGIAQRRSLNSPQHWMVNWARGTAWLLLGTTRLLQELPSHHPALPDLISQLQQIWPTLHSWQLDNGLWSVFTDQPLSLGETSGSAGIATALALAARRGWLPEEAGQAAHRCYLALEDHLEADGTLNGVSQHNPAGEEALQLGYRIRAAWGSGLFLQLHAALHGRP